jgi:glycosyltransferase involved in cell wall biosynthesis
MRVGICAYWFNRGQGVVARQVRSALDSLGHETFVLARPTRAKNIRPAFVDRTGVWDQPGITEASHYRIPADELLAWGSENQLELALFDQNYGFEAIEALRRSGVRTVGRFVWEQFASEHVEPAKRAFDVIYSLTACEQERYATMGIESPRVPWGIHPELLAYARPASDPAAPRRGARPASDPAIPGREAGPTAHPAAPGRGARPAGDPAIPGREAEEMAGICFFYPAGFLSKRKPVPQILKAFRKVPGEARLIVKGQVEREVETLESGARRDPRIEVILEDLPTDEHLRLFASADVCVAPSRWEGLGLHLYEAMGLGLPVIVNDDPPMNEVIRDGENGLLVRSRRRGRARSGIPAYVPSVRGLAAAMRESTDAERLAQLRRGVDDARERLAWEHTVAGYARLLELVA